MNGHLFQTYITFLTEIVMHLLHKNTLLYFVSSRERPWRHWVRLRIHTARRILYASIPVFFFWTCEKAHKLRARWHVITVVIEVRQSIGDHSNCIFGTPCIYSVCTCLQGLSQDWEKTSPKNIIRKCWVCKKKNIYFLPVHKWNDPSKWRVDGSLAKALRVCIYIQHWIPYSHTNRRLLLLGVCLLLDQQA